MAVADAEDLLNKGVIRWPDPGAGTEPPEAAPPRTIVVSGTARSGTSMIAAALHAVGVPLGEWHDDVVFEDQVAIDLFHRNDLEGFRRYAARRDAAVPVWALKRPHLHLHPPAFIEALREPRVVVVFRDPVAIACRNVLAECVDAREALRVAAADAAELVDYVAALRRPTLLMSYEKALGDRPGFADTLLRFCGLAPDPARVAAVVAAIEPGRGNYVRNARRRFEGYVDGVTGGLLRGWARQLGSSTPDEVTLFADDRPLLTVPADQPRADLAAGDIGPRAFEIDLRPFALPAETVITVRLARRAFALTHSGRTLAEFTAMGAG